MAFFCSRVQGRRIRKFDSFNIGSEQGQSFGTSGKKEGEEARLEEAVSPRAIAASLGTVVGQGRFSKALVC